MTVFEESQRSKVGCQADTQQGPAHARPDGCHEGLTHQVVDQSPKKEKGHEAVVKPSIERAAGDKQEKVLPLDSPSIEKPIDKQDKCKKNSKY
jgi:hypothetical protein